jgi:iron-sulfur cluster assembly accessory protein
MLKDIETKTEVDGITISPAAASAVRDILAKRNLEGYSLRVFVSGGGCHGVQFGMALDNNKRQTDVALEMEGVSVFVDDQSINYLYGAKIDFINDPVHGAGFIVDSPSAQGSSCSCGSQGQASSDAEGGSACGCGGSCGCN